MARCRHFLSFSVSPLLRTERARADMLRVLVHLGPSPARGQAVCVHNLQQLLSGLRAGSLWSHLPGCGRHTGLTLLQHTGSWVCSGDLASDIQFSPSQPLTTEKDDCTWGSMEIKATHHEKEQTQVTECVRAIAAPHCSGLARRCLCSSSVLLPRKNPPLTPNPHRGLCLTRFAQCSCPPVSVFLTNTDSRGLALQVQIHQVLSV